MLLDERSVSWDESEAYTRRRPSAWECARLRSGLPGAVHSPS